jgi:HK97 gp10 family phage protein
MTNLIDLRLTGDKDLLKVFDKLPDKVATKVTRSALRAGGNIVKKQAAANAPLRQFDLIGGKIGKKVHSKSDKLRYPGHLKKSVVVKVKKKGKNFLILAVTTTSQAWYGMFIEFGTRFIRATPWLRPAFETTKSAVLKKIEQILWRGIKREAKKLGKL